MSPEDALARQCLTAAIEILTPIAWLDVDPHAARLAFLDAFAAVRAIVTEARRVDEDAALVSAGHVVATAFWWVTVGHEGGDLGCVHPYSGAGMAILAFAWAIVTIETRVYAAFAADDLPGEFADPAVEILAELRKQGA